MSLMCLTCRTNSGTEGVHQKQSSWSGQKDVWTNLCSCAANCFSWLCRSEKDQTFYDSLVQSRHFRFICTKNPRPYLSREIFQPSLQSFSRYFSTYARNLKTFYGVSLKTESLPRITFLWEGNLGKTLGEAVQLFLRFKQYSETGSHGSVSNITKNHTDGIWKPSLCLMTDWLFKRFILNLQCECLFLLQTYKTLCRKIVLLYATHHLQKTHKTGVPNKCELPQ